MSMQPIIVSGFEAHLNRQAARTRTAGYAVSSSDASKLRSMGLAIDDAEPLERPAIEGLAHRFLSVFEMHGEASLLWPGAFAKSIADNTEKFLCVDHDRNVVYASTRSGLHIAEADDGLVFRVELARTTNPVALMGMIESRNRRCVSISYEPLKSELRKFGNHDARVVTEARLVEISLVQAGKSEPAFAFVTDASRYDPPTSSSRSMDFAIENATYRIQQATKVAQQYLEQATGRPASRN